MHPHGKGVHFGVVEYQYPFSSRPRTPMADSCSQSCHPLTGMEVRWLDVDDSLVSINSIKYHGQGRVSNKRNTRGSVATYINSFRSDKFEVVYT